VTSEGRCQTKSNNRHCPRKTMDDRRASTYVFKFETSIICYYIDSPSQPRGARIIHLPTLGAIAKLRRLQSYALATPNMDAADLHSIRFVHPNFDFCSRGLTSPSSTRLGDKKTHFYLYNQTKLIGMYSTVAVRCPRSNSTHDRLYDV
jgi:hypothetical protein